MLGVFILNSASYAASPGNEKFSSMLEQLRKDKVPYFLLRNNGNTDGLLIKISFFSDANTIKQNVAPTSWSIVSILKDSKKNGQSYNTYPYVQSVSGFKKSKAAFVLDFSSAGITNVKNVMKPAGIYNLCGPLKPLDYADSAIFLPGDNGYKAFCPPF